MERNTYYTNSVLYERYLLNTINLPVYYTNVILNLTIFIFL